MKHFAIDNGVTKTTRCTSLYRLFVEKTEQTWNNINNQVVDFKIGLLYSNSGSNIINYIIRIFYTVCWSSLFYYTYWLFMRILRNLAIFSLNFYTLQFCVNYCRNFIITFNLLSWLADFLYCRSIIINSDLFDSYVVFIRLFFKFSQNHLLLQLRSKQQNLEILALEIVLLLFII